MKKIWKYYVLGCIERRKNCPYTHIFASMDVVANSAETQCEAHSVGKRHLLRRRCKLSNRQTAHWTPSAPSWCKLYIISWTKWSLLNGVDCSKITAQNEGGNISRLVVARLKKVSNEKAGVKCKDERSPCLDFYRVRTVKIPFLRASLPGPIGPHPHHDLVSTDEKMISDAFENGFTWWIESVKKTDVWRHGIFPYVLAVWCPSGC